MRLTKLLTLCLFLLFPWSCKDVTDETLLEKVWAFSQTHPDGFTLDIHTMTEPSEGIAVAYAATQGSSHSKEALSIVIDHALTHDGYVGGWLDPDSGLYYFDSTKLFPEDQWDEAVDFGRDNGQRFLYVISTGEKIRIEYPDLQLSYLF